MRVRFPARVAFAVLIAATFAGFAGAAGGTKFVRKGKATTRAEFADFQGKAHLRIPGGYCYLSGDDLAAFNKEAENLVDPEEVGILVPDTGAWYVSVFVPAQDPLGGVAKEDVTAQSDKLLAFLRSKGEAGNKERAAAGLAPLKITGWTHKPSYDRTNNRVTWGYRLNDETEDEESDALNFETILFGPDGEVIEVMMVADLKGYAKPLAEYKKLVNAVEFGSAPGVWQGLSSVFENDNAMYTGAVVLAIVGGAGLMLRRSVPEKRRAHPIPRPW